MPYLPVRLLILLVLAVLAACRSGPRTQEDRAMLEIHLDGAAGYFAEGNHEKAADQCLRALKLDPDNYQALICLATSSSVIGRFQMGNEALEKAAKLESDDPLQELVRGMLYFEWARAEAGQASRLARAAASYSDPSVPGSDTGRARSFSEEADKLSASSRERYLIAQAALLRSESLFGDTLEDPAPPAEGSAPAAPTPRRRLADNSYLLNMLALVHVALGPEHYRTAIGYLERYVATCVDVRTQYEQWYESQRLRMSDAEQVVAKDGREQLTASERKARIFSSWLSLQLARRDGLARRDAEVASQAAQDLGREAEARGHRERALALERTAQAQVNAAIAHLKAIVALGPNTATVHANLAQLHWAQGRTDEAIQELETFGQKNLAAGNTDLQAVTQQVTKKLKEGR